MNIIVETRERTQDVYERLPGIPEPPLVPVPPVGDLSSLEQKGLKITPISQRLVTTAMKLSGLAGFQARLPQDVSRRLRRTNNRLPGLFAPPLSATAAFLDDPRGLGMLERAAALVMAAYDLHNAMYSGHFEPDRYKGAPLEMGQLPNLFGTTLVVDGRGARLFKTTNTSYFTVLANGRFFILSIDPETGPEYKAILAGLRRIVETVRHVPPPAGYISPGPITAGTNRTQRRSFRALRKIPENVQSLHILQHSFFTLTLELDSEPESAEEAARLAHSQHYENRWFHSSLQLVVFENARACAIFNFTAYLDGNAMMRGGVEIFQRALQFGPSPAGEGIGADGSRVQELNWQVDPQFVEMARRDYQPLIYDAPATFTFPNLGRSAYEDHGMSAVPSFVLALLMTARRLTGETPNIIQFLTMNKYCCMDLETAWVTTPEVVRFVEAVNDEDIDYQEKVALMRHAIESQRQAMRRSRRGLSLMRIYDLYMRDSGFFRKVYVVFIALITILILRVLGLYRSPGSRDIVISHPSIHPAIPVFGRPGARLPYVRLFGLHYQMFDDKTVVTFMPGVKWTVPNEKLAQELESDLQKLKELLERQP